MQRREVLVGLGLTLCMATVGSRQSNAAPPLGPVVGGGRGRLMVKPPEGEPGDTFTITFEGFPKPSPKGDALLIFRAGTRDIDPRNVTMGSSSAPKLLYKRWIYRVEDRMQPDGGDLTVGPFAPGTYEARNMTVIYNNANRYEVSARVLFTVR